MDKATMDALSRVDPKMRGLIERVGPITLKPAFRQTPYQALVEAVVYQQLTGRAAATILGRFKALYPGRRFPRPEEILKTTLERLRSAGLSGAKSASILDIARKTMDGTVPTHRVLTKLPDSEILERLTSIRGVGPWTVEMLLIFKLGRPDILPVSDYGVRKGFAKTYRRKELPTPKELQKFGERWSPYRSTAAWYLWRSLDGEFQNQPARILSSGRRLRTARNETPGRP